MAEGVIVEGFGPGASAWATEETLKSVLSTLEESNKISKQLAQKLTGSNASSDTDIAEIFEEIEDAGSDVADALNELENEARETADEVDGLGKSSKKGDKAIKALGVGLGYASTMLGALTGRMVNQLNMVTELNKSGINLGRNIDGAVGGFNSFVTSATEANLTFAELSEVASKYSAVMNQFGIKQFGPMAKTLTADLANLGITSKEGAELLSEYLEQQQTLGVSNRLSQQEQVKNAASTIRQQELWGKTLGKSRTEMMEASKAMKENVNVNAFLNRSSGNVQAAFEQMSAGLAGFDSGASQSIMESLASPIIQTSGLFQQLNSAGMAEAANELVRMQEIITDPNVDPMAAEAAMDDFLKVISSQDTNLAQIIGDSDAALALVKEAKRRDMLTKADEESLEAQQKQAAGIIKATETWKKFTQIFDRAIGSTFGDEKLVKAIENTLTGLSDAFEKMIPPLMQVGASLMEAIVPVLSVLASGLGALAEGVAWVSKELGPNGTLVLALGTFTAFMLAKNKSLLSGGFSDMFGGGGDDDNKKTRKGKKGKGGGLGSLAGIGGGIGSALTGLAAGLTAFGVGSVKILLGATTLAGVITILGVGLALAVAAMSFSLPLVAESLKSFDDVDGNNLTEVGKGLMGLAAGVALLGPALALFAIGGAMAGIGSIIGSIGSAFGSLVGIKSPTEQLMAFAEVGPQMQSAGIGVLALQQGLSGLGDAVNSLPELDVLEDIIDAINKSDPAKMLALANAMPESKTTSMKLELDEDALKGISSVNADGFIKLTGSLAEVSTNATLFGNFVDDFERLGEASADFEVDQIQMSNFVRGLNHFKRVDSDSVKAMQTLSTDLKGFSLPDFSSLDDIDADDFESFVEGVNHFGNLNDKNVSAMVSTFNSLANINTSGLKKLAEASALMAETVENIDNVDGKMGSAINSIKDAKISQLQADQEVKQAEKTTASTDTTASAGSEKENEINTILERQTELLEMLLANAGAQLDNVKKLRRSSEERT